jgi:hypothetical protein
MQININQSQEVADNTITKLPRTKHEKTRKEHRRKNHQTYPKKKKKYRKKETCESRGDERKLTVSDNDAAKTKQEIKTTPQSTNDLENSIAFFISTKKKKAYNTGCGQETPRCRCYC